MLRKAFAPKRFPIGPKLMLKKSEAESLKSKFGSRLGSDFQWSVPPDESKNFEKIKHERRSLARCFKRFKLAYRPIGEFLGECGRRQPA
jgi:hypothetical protein